MLTAVLFIFGACGGDIRPDTDVECSAGHPEDGVCVLDLTYRLDVVTVESSCYAEAIGHIDSRDYRVRYRRAEAELFVDEVELASGTLIGCGLGYASASVPASLLPFDVVDADDWSMEGSASVEGEDSACVDGEREWSGEEAYASGDGCVYTVTWEGDFLGME